MSTNADMPLGSARAAQTDEETVPDAPLGVPAVTDDDAEYGIEDATVETTPEDFDFAAFVEGARPGRRRVTLTMRPDLIAVMEAAITRAEAAEKAGDHAGIDAAVADYEQARATYEASRRPVIVEARSTEWIQNIEKRGKKDHGLDPKKAEDRVTLLLRQIAGQIVHPTKGVTVEALRHLYEVSEPEIDKLYRACASANRGAGVAPDFSRQPSVPSRRG